MDEMSWTIILEGLNEDQNLMVWKIYIVGLKNGDLARPIAASKGLDVQGLKDVKIW
jgi:hypothetical protein